LVDAESGEQLKISVDDTAHQQYTRAFDQHADQIKHLALRNNGRYAGFSTEIPIEEAMFGPLMTVGGSL
jgi:hypothetical protein